MEGLPDFYEVFAANMRDSGSPVHSQQFFVAILEEFAESAKLMLVRKGNQTIGGAVCLSFRDALIVPWASSHRAYFSLCPNNLLYWEIIRWGCEHGYRRLDLAVPHRRAERITLRSSGAQSRNHCTGNASAGNRGKRRRHMRMTPSISG